jgi:hypothetical protein
MDDRILFERQYAGLGEFCRLLGGAAPGSRVLEVEGVLGAVVPAAPERSVVNSVTYPDAAALEQALPELEEAYAAAGVRAWTVWVPHFDTEAAALLEHAGGPRPRPRGRCRDRRAPQRPRLYIWRRPLRARVAQRAVVALLCDP